MAKRVIRMHGMRSGHTFYVEKAKRGDVDGKIILKLLLKKENENEDVAVVKIHRRTLSGHSNEPRRPIRDCISDKYPVK